jgi:hypothetical protein
MISADHCSKQLLCFHISKAIVQVAALKYSPASKDDVHNVCLKKAIREFRKPYQKSTFQTLYRLCIQEASLQQTSYKTKQKMTPFNTFLLNDKKKK